jgi:hypothetical protein
MYKNIFITLGIIVMMLLPAGCASNDPAYISAHIDNPAAVVQVSVEAVPFSTSLSNGTWSGCYVNMTAGENVTLGQVCYQNASDHKWYLAEGNSNSTIGTLTMATETITGGSNGKFLTVGTIRNDAWGTLPGSNLYVSNATAGAFISLVPSGAGDQVQIIGSGIMPDILYFHPDTTVLGLN